MPMHVVFVLVLVTQSICLCVGQTLVVTDDIRKRFDRPADIRWLHTYQGTWENLHPLTLVLAYDGKTYHGISQDNAGNHLFDLHGYHQDSVAMIQEIDHDGRTSGYYVVHLHEGRMHGNWWSSDFARSAGIALKNETVVELRRFQPTLLSVAGQLEEDKFDLVLQREEADLVTGFFTYQSGEDYYRVRGICTDPACDRMAVSLYGSSGNNMELVCSVQRNQVRVTISDENGDQKEGSGQVTGKFLMEKLLHEDYIGNIDCLYPVLQIPAFDTWAKSFAQGWFIQMQSTLDSLHQNVDNAPGPVDRWSFQASAWMDLTMSGTDYISGIITWFVPAAGEYARTSFIFDVNGEKLISLREIGRKQDFTEDLLNDAAELKAPFTEDPAFTEWIAQAVFEHVALAADGFIVFTDFNPLFGDLWMKLRYEDYLNEMRRIALVQDKYK